MSHVTSQLSSSSYLPLVCFGYCSRWPNLQSASFNVQLFCSLITADTCPAKHSTNLLCKARHGPFTIFLAAMMRAQRFKEGTNAVNYICIDTSRAGGVLGEAVENAPSLSISIAICSVRVGSPAPAQCNLSLTCLASCLVFTKTLRGCSVANNKIQTHSILFCFTGLEVPIMPLHSLMVWLLLSTCLSFLLASVGK